VNPRQRIEDKQAGASAGIGGSIQCQITVIELSERVHGQSGAGDIAALRFEQGHGNAVHGRSGED
jgi:hypothetical protein